MAFLKRAAGCLFFLSLLVVCGCSRSPEKTSDSLTTFTKHLDEELPRLMKQYNVPGVSMALIRNGDVVWTGAYGYADVERHQEMTVDSVCRVESISKSVTAWGVMRLVEQGLIDLDAPVQQYLSDWELPESKYPITDITVRGLLSGSAGFSLGHFGDEYPPGGQMPSLRETLSAEVEIIREPGSAFIYSNSSFHLLELVIEEVTGRDYAEYMAEEVLIPLGMDKATFSWHESLRPVVPTGYDLRSNPVPVYVYPAKSSGGLFAGVADIARFVSAGMTGSYYRDTGVLSEEGIRQIHSPEVEISGVYAAVSDSYGLGHFIEELPEGSRAVWHGGQGHGWMTHFHAVPESGDGIVILSNSQRSWPMMARVLNDWAAWSGFRSVGMGRITLGVKAMWVLISLTAVFSLRQVYQLARGLRNSSRRFAPVSGQFGFWRLIEAAAGIGTAGGLVWGAAQPYLMVSSIFPGVVDWAAGSLWLLSGALIASALCLRERG
jgi:CubicO group peptidase (beta-lactamase class C family)